VSDSDVDADDPLFEPMQACGEVPVDEALVDTMQDEGWLPDEEDTDPGDVYNGRKVRWVGSEGRMMKLDWDQVQAAPGNLFVPGKVGAFAELIRFGDRDGNKPFIYAPPVMLSDVTLDDIVESWQAAARHELFDTHGMTRPFTTGDEELDEFLVDPEDYLDTYADEDDEENDEAAIRADMAERQKEAVEGKEGDLGKITAQLRDGNHRAFGAYLADEPDLWVIVRAEPEDLKRLGLTKDDLE
jgi:hypothetical protein